MKSQLSFLKVDMKVSDLGKEASLPDIFWDVHAQNKTKSNLSEYEEI